MSHVSQKLTLFLHDLPEGADILVGGRPPQEKKQLALLWRRARRSASCWCAPQQYTHRRPQTRSGLRTVDQNHALWFRGAGREREGGEKLEPAIIGSSTAAAAARAAGGCSDEPARRG